MRNFRNYKVWQHGMELSVKIYDLSKQLPKRETYSLAQQLQRASISIPSNVAEGCSRSGEKDFRRFIEIALGSAYEVETQLLLAQQLYSLDDSTKYSETITLLNLVQSELNALRNKLK